jgi:hypothetical protein
MNKILMGLLCSTLLFSQASNAWWFSPSISNAIPNSEYDNALDMANLSARVYDDLWDAALDAIAPALIPDLDFEGNTSEFVVVQNYTESWDGFDAKLYYNTDEDSYTLAFRGTQVFEAADWIIDVTQVLNDYVEVNISQYEKAVDLAVELEAQYGDKLQFTGHSLGGGLAQAAGLKTGLQTTCFEAAGLTTGTIEDLGITASNISNNTSVITHINVRSDPLSDFDGHRNNEAPFYNTLQYGDNTYWLDNIWGTGGIWNPMRVVNHFYHSFVYKLTNKDYY